MDISAVYRMELIEKLDKTIWSKYSSYKKVEQYVKLNQTLYDNFGNANFDIVYVNDKIQLFDTLGNIAPVSYTHLIVSYHLRYNLSYW